MDGNSCKFFKTSRGCLFEHFIVQTHGQWSAKEIASLSEKVRAVQGDKCPDKNAILEKINTLRPTI